MIELKNQELIFRFPEVHEHAVCSIQFQRTLRIPDDDREYPLPPGLGRFPVEHVEDHSSRLPSAWSMHGGVLLPMYQAEALWINFSSGRRSGSDVPYPFAVKVAAGKVNAVTGDPWSNDLIKDPQDYLVVPEQPWIDGFCIRKGLVRQFVAMPLGLGYTAEEQITDSTDHGGIQIIVFPMKGDRYEEMLNQRTRALEEKICYSLVAPCKSVAMGLAPGGLMRQEVYKDKHGFDAWDMGVSSRCFVHILNSIQWKLATGKAVPGEPPSASDYTEAGLPWFEYYDDRLNALNGAKNLAGMDSVAAKGVKLGEKPTSNNQGLSGINTIQLMPKQSRVKDGKW